MSSTISCPVPLGKSSSCADAVSLKRLEYTLQFCSLAILYYDYLLTLKDEITYIWMRKWRISTLFYFFCRYALVANVLYLLAISEDFTGVNCNIGYMVCGALSVIGHVGIIAVWTLRTCAVYNNNRWLFAFFGALGSTVAIMLIYRTPFMRCSGQKDLSKLLGANGAIFLFIELFSFLLATWRVWTIRREHKSKAENPPRLYKVIMSQGIMYIGGVSILSVAVLILNFKWKTGYLSRLLNGLKLPLSGFLTARFMLRLRAWDTTPSTPGAPKTHTTTNGAIETMKFGSNGRTSQHSLFDEWKGDIGSTRDAPGSSMLGSDTSTLQGGATSVRHVHLAEASGSSTGNRSEEQIKSTNRSDIELEEGLRSKKHVDEERRV